MTTLAELRQASLQEQKKHLTGVPEAEAQKPAPEHQSTEPGPSAPPVAIDPPAVITPAPVPPVSTPPPTPVSAESAAKAAAEDPDPDPESAIRFLQQVHRSLAHKTMHDNGTRVTVDMPVALFHRSKRYCLEHGNITLRQVLLDLLRAYLDEEGY